MSDATVPINDAVVALKAKGRPPGWLLGKIFLVYLGVSMAVGLLALAAVLIDVVHDGFGRLDSTMFNNTTSSVPEEAGARPAILGTLYIMVLLVLLSVPIGVGTAIYLEEYANQKRWYNRVLEINIANLAAVPSIVYGILGLAFIVRGPFGIGQVLLAGALILTLLVLPIVIISGREAIRAVPSSIRDGGYALGATKWQVTWRQVLPSASPGIATGTILAVSRGIGETAPILMVGGLAYVTTDPSILGGFTVLPIQIYNWLAQSQEAFAAAAAAGIIILLAILMIMNGFAIWLRNRYQQRW